MMRITTTSTTGARRVAISIVLAGLVMTAAACGSEETPSTQPDTAPAGSALPAPETAGAPVTTPQGSGSGSGPEATFIRGATLLRLDIDECAITDIDDARLTAVGSDGTVLTVTADGTFAGIVLFGPTIELEGRIESVEIDDDRRATIVGLASVADDADTEGPQPFEISVVDCDAAPAPPPTTSPPAADDPSDEPPVTTEPFIAEVTALLQYGDAAIAFESVSCDLDAGSSLTVEADPASSQRLTVQAVGDAGTVAFEGPSAGWAGTVESVMLGEIGNATISGSVAPVSQPDAPVPFVLTVAEFGCA